jgi:hypothetical protein
MAMRDHRIGGTMGRGSQIGSVRTPEAQEIRMSADELVVMADVQFAPPLQRLTSPPHVAPDSPPPPPPQPTPAAAFPALRLSAPVPIVRDTSSVPVLNLQELLQPTKTEARPAKRKKKRGKKLLTVVLLLTIAGGAGFYFRNTGPMQRVLGHDEIAPLPDVPFARPNITSAVYTVTLSAVQNGAPNNVTTNVREDFVNAFGESTVESQIGGTFTTTQEIRTRESLIRPGQAPSTLWSRQPRVPDAPSPYDAATFIPMIDDIVDHPLRDAMKPTSSKLSDVDGVKITTLTYVLDRAKVPGVAPAIFARVPWLFDVPNASTLTVKVGYDETGLVRHLFFGVDPPEAGTGIDAAWVTSYSLDVTSVNVPVVIDIPIDVVDVPAGTP